MGGDFGNDIYDVMFWKALFLISSGLLGTLGSFVIWMWFNMKKKIDNLDKIEELLKSVNSSDCKEVEQDIKEIHSLLNGFMQGVRYVK